MVERWMVDTHMSRWEKGQIKKINKTTSGMALKVGRGPILPTGTASPGSSQPQPASVGPPLSQTPACAPSLAEGLAARGDA